MEEYTPVLQTKVHFVSLLQDVKQNVDSIVAEALPLDFVNHSSVGRKQVTIADMQDGDIARGNCWVASNEVYMNLELDIDSIVDVDIVGAVTDGCTHFALYVSNEDEEVVIDFTARQFHADAPFPFILSLHKWHAYMEHVTGRTLELNFGD